MWQVSVFAEAAKKCPNGSLSQIPPVHDPSTEIIEVLIIANKWNLMSRESLLPIDRLPELHQLGVDLLEGLKRVLPERTGTQYQSGERQNQFKGWCFEKAHSVMHAARDALLFGSTEVTNAQGPEHCHIELMKKIAPLTNRKQILLTIMRYHSRGIHLNLLRRQCDAVALECDSDDHEVIAEWKELAKELSSCDKNIVVPCELGIRYPFKYVIENSGDHDLHVLAKVCSMKLRQ